MKEHCVDMFEEKFYQKNLVFSNICVNTHHTQPHMCNIQLFSYYKAFTAKFFTNFSCNAMENLRGTPIYANTNMHEAYTIRGKSENHFLKTKEININPN